MMFGKKFESIVSIHFDDEDEEVDDIISVEDFEDERLGLAVFLN